VGTYRPSPPAVPPPSSGRRWPTPCLPSSQAGEMLGLQRPFRPARKQLGLGRQYQSPRRRPPCPLIRAGEAPRRRAEDYALYPRMSIRRASRAPTGRRRRSPCTADTLVSMRRRLNAPTRAANAAGTAPRLHGNRRAGGSTATRSLNNKTPTRNFFDRCDRWVRSPVPASKTCSGKNPPIGRISFPIFSGPQHPMGLLRVVPRPVPASPAQWLGWFSDQLPAHPDGRFAYKSIAHSGRERWSGRFHEPTNLEAIEWPSAKSAFPERSAHFRHAFGCAPVPGWIATERPSQKLAGPRWANGFLSSDPGGKSPRAIC